MQIHYINKIDFLFTYLKINLFFVFRKRILYVTNLISTISVL